MRFIYQFPGQSCPDARTDRQNGNRIEPSDVYELVMIEQRVRRATCVARRVVSRRWGTIDCHN